MLIIYRHLPTLDESMDGVLFKEKKEEKNRILATLKNQCPDEQIFATLLLSVILKCHDYHKFSTKLQDIVGILH